jgi:DNA mismatch repair ATPase MutS
MAAENPPLANSCKRISTVLVERGDERFELFAGIERLRSYFEAETVEPLARDGNEALICAAGGLHSYLEETQKCNLSHINHLDVLRLAVYGTGLYHAAESGS